MAAAPEPLQGRVGGYGLTDVAISLMRYQLMQLLRHDGTLPNSEQLWDTLSTSYPNYRDFISVLSYQVEPDDAEHRAQVVSALLGLFYLIDKSESSQQMAAMFEPVKLTNTQKHPALKRRAK